MDAKSELRNVRKAIKTLSIKADLSDDEAKQLQDLMAKAVKLEAQVEAQAEADKEDAEAKAETEKAEKEKAGASRLPHTNTRPMNGATSCGAGTEAPAGIPPAPAGWQAQGWWSTTGPRPPNLDVRN